jgi:DNA-binding response OmpR family regulator
MPLNILMIDDEPDICELVELALAIDPDISLRSCGSGQDALQLLEDWSPQGIILDIKLPLWDGYATLARLRENSKTATIPVIIMTALVQAHDLASYRSLEVAAVIEKPFNPMTLASTVRTHVL